MLDYVTATRFIQRMGNGRTLPSLIECEDEDGATVQVVTKFSGKMFEKEKNLAIEAIAAMLGSDIGLPVPEPFVVVVVEDFADLVPDAEIKQLITESCRLAFGSKQVSGGFTAWPTDSAVPAQAAIQAAEIFTFDGIVVNADRRPENPNCLFRGDEFAIFDHELTLCMGQLLRWKAPWTAQGFDDIGQRDTHIFAKPRIANCPASLDRFVEAWNLLDDGRFDEYIAALPPEWRVDTRFLTGVTAHLREAKANIVTVVDNALRALR
jgi:hypothetical protein